MKRETILIILGVLILLSPWAGLPLSILEWVIAILALLVIGMSITLRRRNNTSIQTLVQPPVQPVHRIDVHEQEIIPVELKPRSSRIARS